MKLRLSISALVSIAYFLTLFLFKLFKTQDVLTNLLESGTYAFGIFIIIYGLLTYTTWCFERLKRKEANDAINKIKQLEEEQLAKRNAAIKNKLSKIDKEVLEREKLLKEQRERELEDDDTEDTTTPIITQDKIVETASNFEQQDIEQLKKEAGTQFDSNFTTNNIQI